MHFLPIHICSLKCYTLAIGLVNVLLYCSVPLPHFLCWWVELLLECDWVLILSCPAWLICSSELMMYNYATRACNGINTSHTAYLTFIYLLIYYLFLRTTRSFARIRMARLRSFRQCKRNSTRTHMYSVVHSRGGYLETGLRILVTTGHDITTPPAFNFAIVTCAQNWTQVHSWFAKLTLRFVERVHCPPSQIIDQNGTGTAHLPQVIYLNTEMFKKKARNTAFSQPALSANTIYIKLALVRDKNFK